MHVHATVVVAAVFLPFFFVLPPISPSEKPSAGLSSLRGGSDVSDVAVAQEEEKVPSPSSVYTIPKQLSGIAGVQKGSQRSVVSSYRTVVILLTQRRRAQ